MELKTSIYGSLTEQRRKLPAHGDAEEPNLALRRSQIDHLVLFAIRYITYESSVFLMCFSDLL